MLTTCTRMLILLFISNSVSQAVKSLQTNTGNLLRVAYQIKTELLFAFGA